MKSLVILALLAAGAAQAQSVEWLPIAGGRLKAQVYRSARPNRRPRMVVVLHGDSPFAPPSYQYTFARRVAATLDDVIAVALLRPGYTDDRGDRSDGDRGQASGDNYTPAVVDAVATSIRMMAARVHASRVFLVGHSGGAAIAADLLGRAPDVASGALLVSCPCDVNSWRAHMYAMQGGAIWREPVTSLSPVDLAAAVSPHARVRLVVGSADRIAPPSLSEKYARALRRRGIAVTLTVVPNLGHDVLLEPMVLKELAALLSP
jgi:pimeloyl-ACP methyl ester carboxylesterase